MYGNCVDIPVAFARKPAEKTGRVKLLVIEQ